MSKNNFIISFRTTKENFDLLDRLSKATGFDKTKLGRYLFNKALHDLKNTSKGDFNNLSFSLKEINDINKAS